MTCACGADERAAAKAAARSEEDGNLTRQSVVLGETSCGYNVTPSETRRGNRVRESREMRMLSRNRGDLGVAGTMTNTGIGRG